MKNLKSALLIPFVIFASFCFIIFVIICHDNKEQNKRLANYLPTLLEKAEKYQSISDTARLLSNQLFSYENCVKHDFTRLGIATESRLDSCWNHLAKLETAWELKEGSILLATESLRLYKFEPNEIMYLAEVNKKQLQSLIKEWNWLDGDTVWASDSKLWFKQI